jgi:hypothetical protein
LFGDSDLVDSFVSVGGHDYREDIRQGAFRFLNIHLKNNPRDVTDTEIDLVIDGRNAQHPIRPEELRVFPNDENIPGDAINAKIDESFVPIATPELPKSKAQFESWKKALVTKLRETTFRHFPKEVPAATLESEEDGTMWLRTEGNIRVRAKKDTDDFTKAREITLVVANGTIDDVPGRDGVRFVLEPRGIGGTQWTTKNPPNYVERSHYLLGRTVDSGRVWDIVAAARYLKKIYPDARLEIRGEGQGGVLAIYAAILEEGVDAVTLAKIPQSLMEGDAPALLNALRVCDLPEAIALLADRQIEIDESNGTSPR